MLAEFDVGRLDARVNNAPTTLKRAISKAKWHLLPFLMLLYLFNFLDRVNIGFAALQMNRDLGLSPTVFGFAAGVSFISYMSLEIPSNVILLKVGARRWIGRIMISWGLISAATAFAQGPISLYLLRFLLGAAEAGFIPGILYYLSMWFPKSERSRVTSSFYSAIAVSLLFGAPVSGLLMSLPDQAGLRAWQIMFIAEGVPSVVLGIACLFYLHDKPSQAPWLSESEAVALESVIAQESEGLSTHGPSSLLAVVKDYRAWLMGLVIFGLSYGIYAVTIWLPQILQQTFAGDTTTIGLVAAMPWLASLGGLWIIGQSSDRWQERHFHVAAGCLLATICFAIAASATASVFTIGAIVTGTVGLYSVFGTAFSIPGNFLVGRGAAVGLAMVSALGNISGFAAPYILGLSKHVTESYAGGLLSIAFCAAASGITVIALRRGSL